jgi:hypothetical protein
MRRIRNKNKQEETKVVSGFFDTKEKIIAAVAVLAVVLIIVFAVMLVESGYGNLIVKNKTNLKLEYVKTYFINEEGMVGGELQAENVAAKKTSTINMPEANLTNTNSNLEVKFKFENNQELFTDVGTFNSRFNGDLKITFEKTDDPNKLKLIIKASKGVFQTKTVDCNEEFTVDLKQGQIIE